MTKPPPPPPRTASGSGLLLRSVFAGAGSEVAAKALPAPPRSGPAWFGDTTGNNRKHGKGGTSTSNQGMLKSPAELGRRHSQEENDEGAAAHAQTTHDSSARRQKTTRGGDPTTVHTSASGTPNIQACPTVLEMRQRKQTLFQKQQAAWRQEEDLWREVAAAANEDDTPPPSCVTALTYQGMEVWMGTTEQAAYVCMARTLLVLQVLPDWPTHGAACETIVSIRSHPTTGQIVLVGNRGRIQTYRPVRCTVTNVSIGRFRWESGPVVHTRDLFATDKEYGPLHVSLSADWKVLVACGPQLAVWDTAGRSATGNAKKEAPVLWMTKLPAPVQAASIAGDGHALAVVLTRLSEDDSNEADGVHTFERDWDDGAEAIRAVASQEGTDHTPTSNVGIVYRPGPFLVHSAPVTRLLFRGVGFCTSSYNDHVHDTTLSSDASQISNDLLLTTATDGTARIFGQEGWKPLTEWTCGTQTRVDWIRGQAAFSLGDLEAKHATSGKKSRTMSRSPSKDTLDSYDYPQAVGTESQNHRIPSIPAHTTPLSQAGAWIAEISWESNEEDPASASGGTCLPWISLSRLTYLKRGTGDLVPTLLESVSAVLPPASVMKSTVLARIEDSLAVEGLWPAWNPFVDVPLDSSPSNTDMIETLRGSAMAFLGLAQTDGYFGDALLQGTQCPPTELRLTTTHPVSGHVVILEFHLHGQDKNLDALELGAPIRSIASFDALELNAPHSTPTICTTPHGGGKLWATVTDGRRIQLHWRQPGTQNIVPAQWLSSDVASPPETIHSILQGATRFRDESLLPVPLALRPLPASTVDNPVQLLQWWPERSEILPLHGPRLLLAWKKSGGATVLQVLPHLSERTIPEDGTGSLAFQRSSEAHYLQRQGSSHLHRRNTLSDTDGGQADPLYEVTILPDPNYGLGLRLESLDDGEPAVAGSFKKNPETDQALPAEQTGLISLGDELVSVNGIALEDKTFDDVINTVREVGANASPGNPVRMRFRRKTLLLDSVRSSSTDASSNRQTQEQMMNLPRDVSDPKHLGTFTSTGTISSLESLQTDSLPLETVQDPSIVAELPPVEGMSKILASTNSDRRVVLVIDPSTKRIHSQPPPLLLVAAFPDEVHLGRLRLPSNKAANMEYSQVGSVDLPSVELLSLVKTTPSQVHFVAATSTGLHLIMATLREDGSVDFEKWTFSENGLADPQSCIIRSHSLHFIATSELQDGRCKSINVWTPRLHPGCDLASKATHPGSNYVEDYAKASIDIEAVLEMDNFFEDFQFVSSGFFDSSPLLLTFSLGGVSAYQRRRGSFDWVLATSFLYGHNLTALPLHVRPNDCIPHLISAVRKCFYSEDETKFLRSDWHPDSLLARICTAAAGIRVSLKEGVRKLLMWFAENGKEMLEEFPNLPILCSDLTSNESDGNENQTNGSAESNSSLFGMGSSMLTRVDDEATHGLKSFRDNLVGCLQNGGKSGSIGNSCALSMTTEDVRILLALIRLVLEPPAFQNADKCGELFLFAATLLKEFSKKDEQTQGEDKPFSFQVPAVLQRQSMHHLNKKNSDKLKTPYIASAACVAGLLSASQTTLLSSAKGIGVNLDWPTAKRLRVPFWMRSDVSLAQVSEEVGQTMFREKRDIMECAIFFVIAKKNRKLRNLAATDKSESGSKFFKFITSHDFSSERGRRAAEKNAFSLLRKNKYQVAAGFFLLSEPPALQSALEIILTKMKDMELAFMVGRLMESKQIQSDSGSTGFSSGGLSGFGGIIGGGGGYAGTGSTQVPEPSSTATESFHQWTPFCGNATKKLLVERLLPWASSDPALGAIFLLWMNKREEASWWLSGFIESGQNGTDSPHRFADDAKSRFLGRLNRSSQRNSGDVDSFALEKCNTFIDFTSLPLLLQTLKSGTRVMKATSLLVLEAMTVRGVDIPCLWSILSLPCDDDEGGDAPTTVSPADQRSQTVTSSIFDNFDTRPPVPKGPQSSIFDDFNAPPTVPKAPQSSIFDDFEPPPKPKATSSGNPQSSIFDSFDYQPPQNKNSSNGLPQSSIFDSFDVPPKQKTLPTAVSGGMESSIFDSFDAPAAKPPVSAQTSPEGGYQGEQSKNQAKETALEGSRKTVLPAPELNLHLRRMPTPKGWSFLSEELMLQAASRRLCRIMASIFAMFHGDPPHVPLDAFFKDVDVMIPSAASDVLQRNSDARSILSPIQEAISKISHLSGLSKEAIVESTADFIAAYDSSHRTLFGAVVNTALGRTEAAEAIVRFASESVLYGATTFATALGSCSHQQRTRSSISSLHLRREAVRTCWQLETCLWLHRGGGLPLSSLAVKESILAIRMGLTLGSWNRHYETLESLLRCEADCLIDDESGRYLWSSLKDPTPLDIVEEQPKKTTSGGWEFLVDCRRSEATEILRECPTGSFIIRPHPNDHGAFTLSFKTNLIPGDASSHSNGASPEDEGKVQEQNSPPKDENKGKKNPKGVRKDDVVQHAIIRLSDSGFRCGSFGPFSSLIELLEAVSSSLPFKLRFDLPPQNRVIREEGSQPSPNAVLFRKLALGRADSLVSNPPFGEELGEEVPAISSDGGIDSSSRPSQDPSEREQSYGCFLELLVLSRLRRQLCSIASVKYFDGPGSTGLLDTAGMKSASISTSNVAALLSLQLSQYNAAYWLLQPLLSWCRCMEVRATIGLAPAFVPARSDMAKSARDVSEKSIELTLSSDKDAKLESGDAILRRLIQRDSGVEFSTLRLVDGGDCSMVVLFSKAEAMKWLLSTGNEESEESVTDRLAWMEKERIIEALDLTKLPLKRSADMDEGMRYRIVDPWEVEVVLDREGETRSAVLGRQQYHAFSLGKIALACENDFRNLGGLPLLELWTSSKGGVIMSRALACVHPPWERSAGGDLQVSGGQIKEPEPFENAIRQHLYRNSLFRRLGMPQRFMALVQVELLDLKNLTSPTGSLSLTVYGLLRLKRKGSSGVLSNKTRTLDTAQTPAVRLGKPTGVGPNAPATWGSVVRFRFPLPEGVNMDGSSLDPDRESLFRGPPSVLQISVYEKKLLVDTALGTADITTDGLWTGGQLEEWVPLRSEKHGGIHWFARIRLTLRFELMLMMGGTTDGSDTTTTPPSVGLDRITALTQNGGMAHEDHKRRMSSPDLLGQITSMVY